MNGSKVVGKISFAIMSQGNDHFVDIIEGAILNILEMG